MKMLNVFCSHLMLDNSILQEIVCGLLQLFGWLCNQSFLFLVMARGLLRINSIGSVFVPSGCVLRWLFKIPSLVSCVAKSWVSQNYWSFFFCGQNAPGI